MKEIKDQFSLVGGPLKASTKSHILASTSDIYDEFWGTYQNVINEYNSNPLDAFLVQNKGIITEIINSTKIQTLTKTTLNAGDLCLGIYKDDTQTNSKYDYSNGEYLIPGYKSVYFTITEISNDYIAVSVEKDEIKPNTIFVVIGNTKNGINFSLNTEDFKADFIKVQAFKIVEDNIKNISGKFTYNGVQCEGTLLDKIYTSNSIEYLSNAPSLNSAFKSTVFTRNPDRPSVPTGGRYDNPIPVDVDADGKLIWSDGIPDGNAILWASTRIFSSDEKYPQQEVWTEPKQMTDTADFDVAFSSIEDNPGDPTNNKDNWANTADESTIWMATSTCKNGVWSAWQISKIKGEKGNDGTSISIQGSARKVDTLPIEQGSDKALLFTNHQYEGKTHPWIYLWNKTKWEAYSGNAGESYLVDGNLYVWDGDSWENAGSFKGDKGESAYIHIKYAQQDDEGEEVTLVDGSTIKLSFTDSNGDVPGLYLGLKPDNIVEDSENINDYTWAKWKGEDGFGYEYIYIGTADYTNPGVPKSISYNGKSPNDDDYVPEGWSDNPVKIDSKTKYCWMCHRQKVDGKWSNYKGVDDTWASLWAKWSEDGKGITSITRKYQVSNSTNKEDVINGTWSESSPAVNPENIYLWEWIHTEYSIGNPDDDYAIIGRMGEPGIDGKYNEYIYCLTDKNEEPDLPNKKDNIGNDEDEWTDDPKSVSEEQPYQWISEREYDPSKKQWGEYSTPVLWNIWAKGENSIHLDLDNQMDSMLYNDSGEPISSAVVTNPTLYDGITPVKNTDIVWELNTQEPTDYYTFDNTIGKLTVNGISADQNTVIYSIIANYKSAKYVASLTIKKLVGVDKYDLVITPNSFAFNITTETPSEADCTIEVYRTDQNGNRGLVEKLDTGFSLNIDGFGSWQYGDTYEDEYYENGITFEPDWNKDYCRIQLLKNNIIIDTETIPINKSKDGVDGSAIRLDLSNENDSMLYDSAGTLLSGNVISTATLYNGAKIVPSSEYNLEIVSNGCVAELNVNTITVSSITATSANVEVVAIYKEVPYVTNLNIKKLVGVDKYDLAITPNSIAYNTSTTELSSDTINIGVYRTSQSEGRKLVTNLSKPGLNLKLFVNNQNATNVYNSTGGNFSPSISSYITGTDIRIVLKDSNDVVLDTETIPINKSKNGSNSVSIIPSPRAIVAKKSTGAVIYKVDVSVMDGANLVGNEDWSIINTYYAADNKWHTLAIWNEDGNPACPGDYIVGNLKYTALTETDSNTRTINLELAANASVETYFSFAIKYNDVIYNQKIDFKTVGDGETAITYEIVPTNSYYTLDQNTNKVSGMIEGVLYKITGTSREAVKNATIEYGGSNVIETNSSITTTDSTGAFSTEDYFDDKPYVHNFIGSSPSILARYKLNGQIVAQCNVSLAKNGLPGAVGKQSAPLRVSEWTEGTTYYTGYEENDPWSDVVYTNSNGKPVYYRCIKENNTHDKDLNLIEPTNTQYWTKFDGQFESVATGLLLAENAYVDLLSGNTINIKDSLGNITAGMSGGDGIQLWAGGQKDTANFRVEKDGDVHIKGAITYDTTPEELYVDESGSEPTLRTKDCYIIDMVKTKSLTINSGEKLVLFPQQNEVILWNGEVMSPYTTRGTKITISRAFDYNVGNWPSWRSYDSANDYSAWKNPNALYKLLESATLLCADGRIFSDPGISVVENNWSWAGDSDRFDGCFVINGRLAKFLLILPGQTVTFTSGYYRTDMGYTWDENNGISISEKGHLVWCLDNPQDFEPIYQKVDTANSSGADAGYWFSGPAISASDWGINSDRSESMWAPAPLNEARYAFSSGTIIISLVDKQDAYNVVPRWYVSTGNQFDPGSTVTQSWREIYKKGESHWLNAWKLASMTERYLDSQYVSK